MIKGHFLMRFLKFVSDFSIFTLQADTCWCIRIRMLVRCIEGMLQEAAAELEKGFELLVSIAPEHFQYFSVFSIFLYTMQYDVIPCRTMAM